MKKYRYVYLNSTYQHGIERNNSDSDKWSFLFAVDDYNEAQYLLQNHNQIEDIYKSIVQRMIAAFVLFIIGLIIAFVINA